MNYAKAEMWKAEKSELNRVKPNLVKQISGFALSYTLKMDQNNKE